MDLTKPNVKLTAADLGQTFAHACGELLIHWEASDMMLAARPITILFSEHPGETLVATIAAGMENTWLATSGG